MQNLGYMLATFAIVWAVLFGYVLVLVNRQSKLRREIEALRNELKQKRTT